MRKDRIDAAGAATLVAFALAMGFNQVLIKLTNEGLQPIFQAGLRSVLALPVVVASAWLMRQRLSVTDGTFWPGMAIGLCFSVEFIFIYTSLDLTSVSRASILFYTMPIWLALGAHVLIPGERMTLRKAIGLTMALGGVALALSDRGGDGSLLGDLYAIGAAVMWACIALIVRSTALSRATPEMQLGYQLTVSAIVLLAISPLFGPHIREFVPVHLLYLFIQGVLIVGVMFLVWFYVLSVYPASDMAAFGFLAPVFGVILGWALLGEDVGLSIIGALVLVSAGIYIVNSRSRRPQA